MQGVRRETLSGMSIARQMIEQRGEVVMRTCLVERAASKNRGTKSQVLISKLPQYTGTQDFRATKASSADLVRFHELDRKGHGVILRCIPQEVRLSSGKRALE